MVWPLVAMAGLSALQGLQQRDQMLEDEAATNKAIFEANEKNWERSLFNVGLLNVQRGQKLRSLVQQQSDIGVQELMEAGAVEANAAASGTTGASTRQVELDASRQFERARALIAEENAADAFNFNTQLEVSLRNTLDSMQQAQKSNIPSVGQVLLGAGMQAAGTYAMSRFQLGLTSKPKPTASSVPVVEGVAYKG